MSQITLMGTFVVQTCCRTDCGITFAMSGDFDTARRRDHTVWYCPRGHSQHYAAKSDLEREREAREAAEQRARWATESRDSAQREATRVAARLRATKGVVTRIKRRVGHGVCPCCKRSFENLARHMAGKHPSFGKKEAARAES